MDRRFIKILSLFLLITVSCWAFRDAVSENSVDEEKLSSAIGHYSRARALLIAAVHEFDRARQLSAPGPLLDSGSWRNGVIDRAEELEKVLDPRPRSSRSGVRIEGDSRIIGEARR